jgi:hypothetical protein
MKNRTIQKLIFLNILVISGLVFLFTAKAADTLTASPVPDMNCLRFLATDNSAYKDGVPVCDSHCPENCLYEVVNGVRRQTGHWCKYDSIKCEETPLKNPVNCLFDPLCNTLAPDVRLLVYVRGGLFAVFSLAAVTCILFGLYAMYLRSMSEGSPDKLEVSNKVMKNVIVGLVILLLAVTVVQIMYLLLGLTGSILDFNFIPKSRNNVAVTEADIGRICLPEQTDTNGKYICDPETSKWVQQ